MSEPSTSSKEEVSTFDFDEWEKEFVEECPELAEMICRLDEIEEKKIAESTVSKKQQKRDRVLRLAGMMKDGRDLFEKSEKTKAISTRNAFLGNMACHDNGPMAMLARAMREKKTIEIRTRETNTIDRIFVGTPTAFDPHLNITLVKVRETVLIGRHCEQDVEARNRLNQLLPQFLRWKDGGEWPMKIGTDQLVQFRDQRACFVKGNTVVLIRLL